MGYPNLDPDVYGVDETSSPVGNATRVAPNKKCNGCLHYEMQNQLCLAALQPESCGDGSEPETGYAPLIPDAQAYKDWRSKRMHRYSAPTAQADAGPMPKGPSYKLEVIGDSTVTKSVPLVIAKAKNHARVHGLPRTPGTHGVNREDYHAPHGTYEIRAHRKGIQATYRRKGSSRMSFVAAGNGPEVHGAILAHHQRRSGRTMKESTMKSMKPKCSKCSGLMKNDKCMKCGSYAMKGGKPATHEVRTAGVKQAMHAIRTGGPAMEKPKTLGDRIRSVFGKAAPAAAPAAPPKATAAVQAVKTRMMSAAPNEVAHGKAKQAGGGKVFHSSKLAATAGVPHDTIKQHAVESQHSGHFVQHVRSTYGEKVKHLTDGQIRSAYHSMNLQHSIRPNLAKALGVAKSHAAKKVTTVGHTTTGKPIHSNGHGADSYSEDDHRDAGEVHHDLAERMRNAAHGGTYKGTAHHAARKYLMACADHHSNIGSAHNRKASEMANARYEKMRAKDATNKGFGFSANPSDAEIAKAIMATGGQLSAGAMLQAPVNIKTLPDSLFQTFEFPEAEEQVAEVVDEPLRKDEPRFENTVGGVPSAAWDLGQRRSR